MDPEAPSSRVNEEVTALLRQAASIYDVDTEKLAELKPDVILTQDQCDVCAVLGQVEAAARKALGNEVRVVSLSPSRLSDVLGDVGRVAAALGRGDAGAALNTELAERIGALAGQCSGLPRLRVACIEWIDPLMMAGNWVPELVTLAGGEDLFGTPGGHAGWLEMSDLVEADPDVIVLMPCGFGIDRTLNELPALSGQAAWRSLTAVKQANVFVTDGNSFFNRPGPRLVESLEIMAEILHPSVFGQAHGGTGWRRLTTPAYT